MYINIIITCYMGVVKCFYSLLAYKLMKNSKKWVMP